MSVGPWPHVHQHSKYTNDIECMKIWELRAKDPDTMTIIFDITFDSLKEWAGRLNFCECHGVPRRPFIPCTCSHFVLGIQEETPCGRHLLYQALLLPVKQGAPPWTILMHERDMGFAGGRRGEGRYYCVLCCLSVCLCKQWMMAAILASAMDCFYLQGVCWSLHCPAFKITKGIS